MKFKSFTLKNYKGITIPVTFSIETARQSLPYCVIGNNESGKTTLLKGIELIGKLCKGHKLGNGSLLKIRPKSINFSDEITLSAVLETDNAFISELGNYKSIKDLIDSNNNQIEVRFCYGFENSINVGSSYQIIIGEAVLNEQQKTKVFNTIKKLSPTILYYDEFMFSVPDVIRFAIDDTSKNDIYVSTQNAKWQEIFNNLYQGMEGVSAKGTFQKEIVKWAQEQDGDTDTVDQRLTLLNSYFNNVVSNGWLDVNGEMATNPFSFHIEKANTTTPGFIDYQIRIKTQTSTFNVSERSKGCQWFVCFKILTDIRARADSGNILFLLDEPASNLHIHPQEKILTSLENLCQRDNIVVIYSTHSPFLVNPNNYEYTYSLDNSANDSDALPSITCKNIENAEEASKAVFSQSMIAFASKGSRITNETIEFFKKFNTVNKFIENIMTLLK